MRSGSSSGQASCRSEAAVHHGQLAPRRNFRTAPSSHDPHCSASTLDVDADAPPSTSMDNLPANPLGAPVQRAETISMVPTPHSNRAMRYRISLERSGELRGRRTCGQDDVERFEEDREAQPTVAFSSDDGEPPAQHIESALTLRQRHDLDRRTS